MSRKNVIVAIIVVVIATIVSSCNGRTVYSHYASVDILGWNMDTLLRYEVAIPDTTVAYDMSIRVRSTDVYPYENLWLFVQTDNYRDTVELFLSDDRGNRLGNEHNGYNDLCIDLASDIRFKSDTVHIAIQHGMRDADLVGVCAIGLELKKK